MSPNRHSIEAVSTAKKFKTPLKASVVLLTSMILAACNTTDDPSYNLDDIFSPLPGATDKEVEKAKAEAEKAKAEAEAAKAEAAKKIAEAEKVAKAEAEAAKKAIAEAEKARVEAEKATADALKAKEEAEKALEDALANAGGGDKEALQKEADRKAKIASEAAVVAKAAADAQAAALVEAQAKIQAAQAAATAAEVAANAAIKNAPETTKSGIQSLNVNVAPLGKVYNTTTREFESTENSIIARADLASESAPGKGDGLLGKLSITTSGDNDTKLQDGFMSHKDNAEVSAVGQKLPLAYTSTYKDFGDDMRIGHIDGKADFSGAELPVSGVAVVGNATKASNMPTEGKVGYTGDATYRKLGIGNNIEFGTSVFTADFVAKNIKGDLTFDKAGKIGLTAGINGNQFSGTAANNAGYSTEGGFFGGDAQYVGGVYEGNGAQGTYGAKSDKQTQADKAAEEAAEKSAVAEKASAAAQAKAAQAQAAAEKAKADAEKAKVAAEKAQAAADNAGSGDAGALQDALDRAEAAEQAAEKAKAEAAKAKAAAEAAAKKLVDAANAEAAAAKKAAEQAKADAKKAKEDAEKAQNASKEEAAAAKKAAEEAEARAKAAELKAQEAADKAKAAVEKAKADADARVAQAQKAAAEAAKKSEEKLAAAEKAKADAIKAKEAAEKALEDALAAGGGSEALQKEADRKAKLAEEAQGAADAAQTAAQAAQKEAEAEATAAAAAQQDAQDAASAAEIKNAAETAKSGVQSLDINAGSIGLFKTTTSDFTVSEDGTVVNARADLASDNPETEKVDGLLPQVLITTSGADDTQVANSNGFMSHKDSTSINALGMDLPLTYTSTYKDFGNDEMRIGHINGSVAALGQTLPVNGVVVIGNATEAANVPTEGKVGYTGDATYRELGLDKAIEFGNSVFTADFVAKNVKGDLTFSDKTIGLEATIDGNKFSGTKDGYNADGGFYGGDAQYLGGIYEGKGAQGTYGAKSDKQTAAEKAAADAKAQAAVMEKALAAAQAQATAAQAAATKAQTDAAKAKADAVKAQEAADNAGIGGDDKALQEALDRAEKAEAAAVKAQADAALAVKKATAAAQEEVKAAQEEVKAAQSETATAQAAVATAEAKADKAEKDAAAKIAAAKSAAEEDVAAAQADADKAIADAAKAREDLLQAQEDTQAAEDRAAAAATAAAAAEQKAQELQDQLNNTPKWVSAAEAEKSGIQHLSVDATALGAGVNTTTTRNFAIRSTSDVDARADLALVDLPLVPVAIKVSGDNDVDTENGFKAYEGAATVLAKDDLAYTSVYKDFGDKGEMRIAHIDGVVSAGGGAITAPVDGVAVVGNKTATLPTDGKFEYAGDATNRKVGLDNAIEYGSSEFTADFVASKVDGTLKFAQAGEIGLSADITGNEFSGAAADDTGYNTEGAFYGKDANFIGGIYEGNGSQGTFGAEKDGTAAELVVPVEPTPVEPTDPADTNITGFQSTALSSKERELPFNQGQLDSAIGYSAIRGDKDTWSGKQADVAADGTLPADKVLNTGDNFTAFDTLSLRADMVKPKSIQKPLEISLPEGKSTSTGTIGVEAGKPGFNPDFKYNAVYESFDTQMQTGHVYGFINSSVAGDVSRVANVYVQGNLTSQAYMDYLSEVNDGKAKYSGIGTATYMENIHLDDFDITKSGFQDNNWAATPTEGAITAPVKGDAAFNVDFVNSKLEGTLSFDAGDYKYMPANNEIKIEADITGNTFAGNNGIDTAGGFYGDKAEFLVVFTKMQVM
ncbi:transferrin-binding protein-like solute binding protein [Psychrobacter immobilis]|uniref:transferrin-binding protein-like solute binding protein n=1 Tax=Psychrobacter immobilis TaxID=498 RepID=UPI0019194CE5|nr:transferrin-binding protein-like solute binding protein [Psychrobacter immobilis]